MVNRQEEARIRIETLRDFAFMGRAQQVARYTLVLPDASDVYDEAEELADRIEREAMYD